MPTSVSSVLFGGSADKASGFSDARAIDAQQREIGRLVFGEPVGAAEARNDDALAIVGELALGDDMALIGHHDARCRIPPCARSRPDCGSPNGRKELVMVSTSGSMMPSIAWSNRMVMPRASLSLR